MTALTKIEKLAFELPEQQRATLAARILASLPAIFSDSDDGVAEARRRDAEMDKNPSIGISMAHLDKLISKRRRS